jgi:hypothetical protein
VGLCLRTPLTGAAGPYRPYRLSKVEGEAKLGAGICERIIALMISGELRMGSRPPAETEPTHRRRGYSVAKLTRSGLSLRTSGASSSIAMKPTSEQ